MNGEDTKPDIPVRTWGDLWKFAAIIALLIGSYTAVQLQVAWHTTEIQELKEQTVRKDVLDPQIVEMQQRLVRIETKLDTQAAARAAH